jgi:peptidoglycan/xylan/chitin deacetylase (PgdA/CDA1 family)
MNARFTRRHLIQSVPGLTLAAAAAPRRIPDRTVVVTFDDAVKSHRAFVAPLLKELGFRATFFVTHLWMDDKANFMTWEEIAEIHRMGFEIGNHAWTHADYSTPRDGSRLAGELSLTEYELGKAGVPRPVSYAHCGNKFGPEALQALKERGYKFARRGLPPEAEYGTLEIGSAFDPAKHHPLLIPSTGDAYPAWTVAQFEKVLAKSQPGTAVVFQFHGVPDLAHAWVHTPPENFRQYMALLKDGKYNVLAIRDLEPFIDLAHPPEDPMQYTRYSPPKDGKLPLAPEMAATRADFDFWLQDMALHKYTLDEAAAVTGLSGPDFQQKLDRVRPPQAKQGEIQVWPYPGGRHPRIGFLDGAVSPLRGTKASIFTPWDPSSYIVVDLPEAIFSNVSLLFLAHTHIPTIWDDQNIAVPNRDWQRPGPGRLSSRWELRNGVVFGASLTGKDTHVEMELFLTNGTTQELKQLRTQICVLLKGATDFNQQSAANKLWREPVGAVSSTKDRWILTSWERCGRVWGNAAVPCMHSDPVLPDCAPGQTVRVRGKLWFYEGSNIQDEIARSGAN